MKQPMIFAHRGASGQFPENTLPAFEEARKVGAAGIELDVQLTKDGQVVIIHDETLQRTTDGTGYVQDLTLQQIKKLDAGSWFSPSFQHESIPTLEEVFQWMKKDGNSLQVNIELKNNVIHYKGLEEKVLALIEAYHLEERIILSSFNALSLQRVRMLHPTIETGYLIAGKPDNAVWIANEIGANAIHCQPVYALSSYADEAKKAGFPLRVYTVNRMEELEGLMEVGIDTVMTDEPGSFSYSYNTGARSLIR
ncbi:MULTISPECIES: glycerophosphodiester phosphodiesterase [Sporosarcina]|uniref:glycerophosphodiester phosphodiesterase n=1 Tax=Sporosarcina TaxID=1569 RepID=UPI00129C0BF7|nr:MULTISPECIES: glycerophosphodiester phosphodiesterase [Sporosarcina]GKV66134.1 glycerophosphoryl diester phosphodiesterase [Sporosarcina sp. NCCP-2331]GLB56108.1 glycerophosphoryl diester phosphodiesterase [Sporosarcina sp. NCCP-2378]